MSLVNDMLKDLDAGKREPMPEGVFPESTEEDTQPWPMRRLVLLVLMLAIIPAAFYVGLQWRSSESSELPVAPASTEAVPLSPGGSETNNSQQAVASDAASRERETVGELLLNDPLPTEESVAQENLLATDSKAGSGEPSATDNTRKINQLLDAAKLALSDDRLTSPLDDNAFSRYQAILLMEPSHPQALEGVRNVAERYLVFYARTRREGDRQAANYYLDKARRVANRYPRLASSLDKDIAKLAEEFSQAGMEAAPRRAEAASGARTDDDSLIASAAEESNASTDSQVVRRSPSASEVDKRIAAQARQLIQQRRYGQAQSLLLSHLDSNPASPVSRQVLFDVYLATDDIASAHEQIQRLSDLPGHEQAWMKARIAMHDGDLGAALTLMEESPPVVRDAPDYHSYLAALYHKAEQYSDAASAYQQLLALDDSQPTYWLGLAVSLDALKDGPGALRAFRYARRHSRADSPNRRYVEERIQSLSS